MAGTIRGLVPAMKYQDARRDLEWLAADYERLAEFADARRRSAHARERRAALTISARHRAEMETLGDEFHATMSDTMRIRTEFIRTELELGLTFVDGAMNALRQKGSQQRWIRNAIAALITVNKFLALEPRINDSEIHRRRDELRQRLREFLREQES